MIFIILILLLYVLPIVLIIDALQVSLKSGEDSAIVLEIILILLISLVPIFNWLICIGAIKHLSEEFKAEELEKLSWFGYLFKTIKYEKEN